MTKDEALKLALDYLERHAIIDGIPVRDAIKEVLAQELFGNSEQLERQEPVAWMCQEYRAAFMGDLQWFDEVEFVQPPNDPERFRNITPLFASPPQREWVGLTDEEVIDCFEVKVIGVRLKADAIRQAVAALKEKNQ